jgi:translation initiation factor IF-1
MWGCSNKKQENGDEEPITIAPVKVTHIQYHTLADTLTVYGQVMEGQKFILRAPVTGYVTKIWVHPGDQVHAGQRLFSIRTREQAALGNDTAGSSLPKPSDINVKAPVSGQISSLSTGFGVYATSGSSMASMTSNKNVYLKVFIPMRWRNKVTTGDSVLVQWADGHKRWAKLGDRLVQADRQSQAAMYIVNEIPASRLLSGERLTLHIPVNKVIKQQVLPRDAVLTDESMSSYWVMKMINDSTAVRINVTPGISTKQWTAILKPEFKEGDRILREGNYGLADTAQVRITNQP